MRDIVCVYVCVLCSLANTSPSHIPVELIRDIVLSLTLLWTHESTPNTDALIHTLVFIQAPATPTPHTARTQRDNLMTGHTQRNTAQSTNGNEREVEIMTQP